MARVNLKEEINLGSDGLNTYKPIGFILLSKIDMDFPLWDLGFDGVIHAVKEIKRTQWQKFRGRSIR